MAVGKSTPMRVLQGMGLDEESSKGCLKAVVVGAIAFGVIALVVGSLAFLSCQGLLPAGINTTISYYSQLDAVNSTLIAGAGLLLLVAGIAAWVKFPHSDDNKVSQPEF